MGCSLRCAKAGMFERLDLVVNEYVGFYFLNNVFFINKTLKNILII